MAQQVLAEAKEKADLAAKLEQREKDMRMLEQKANERIE